MSSKNTSNLLDIINKVQSRKLKVPNNYDALLNHLRKVEGGRLHRNPKESDVTTGYGIYRGKHNKSVLMMEYLDRQAHSIGITSPSRKWTKREIRAVNATLNHEIEQYLTYLFYNKFLKGARIEKFRPSMAVVIASLYTSSPKGTWLSVQEGLQDMCKARILKLPLTALSALDGKYGTKTENALKVLDDNIHEATINEQHLMDMVFRRSVLLAMKSFYTRLIVADFPKYGRYAKGWDKRVEYLEHV